MGSANNVNQNLPNVEQYVEKLKGMSSQIEALVGASNNEKSSATAQKNEKDKKGLVTAAEEAVKQLNEMMKNMSKDLRFHLFVDGTDLAYVEVIDPKTNKVIRQVPPEQLIEALLRIHDAIGIILDKYI